MSKEKLVNAVATIYCNENRTSKIFGNIKVRKITLPHAFKKEIEGMIKLGEFDTNEYKSYSFSTSKADIVTLYWDPDTCNLFAIPGRLIERPVMIYITGKYQEYIEFIKEMII